MTEATSIYRAIMFEVERRRLDLGWSMWQVDDAAGINDGHYAKMLYPDTPSGRQAKWPTLQLVIEAMFKGGFRVTIEPESDAIRSAPRMDRGRSTNALVIRHWRHTKHFKDLGAKGGKARAAKHSANQMSTWAKRAVRARWKRRKEEQRKATVGAGGRAIRAPQPRPPGGATPSTSSGA